MRKLIENSIKSAKLYGKSGDIVTVNENGDYFIVGRKDDTIKTAGFRVNLSDIDAYILKLNYINNVATIATESEGGENDLIAFLILNDDSLEITNETTADDIDEWVFFKILA